MSSSLAKLALMLFVLAAVAFVADVLSPLTPIPDAGIAGKLLSGWLFAFAVISLWTVSAPRPRLHCYQSERSAPHLDSRSVVVFNCSLRR